MGRYIDMYAISGIAATAALLLALLFSGSDGLDIGPLDGILSLYVISTALAITRSQAPYMSVIELGTIGPALALFLA